MKLVEFARRYKWYLLAALLIYLVVSLWLLHATDDAQDVPFVYQVF
jgi:hypothetical protein